MIRVRLRNKFDVSEPSSAVSIKIEDMLPNEPTLIPGDEVFDLKPQIRFRRPSINPGGITKFEMTVI